MVSLQRNTSHLSGHLSKTMGSTSIPDKDLNMVSIHCKTPVNGQLDFDIDMSQFAELLNTLVDCKYKSTGCFVNDYMKDIKEHEERCLHRTVRCPIKFKDGLCEDILVMNLVQHVQEYHHSDYMSTEESVFSLPIDPCKEIELSKMVAISEDIIVCRLKCVEDQKLHVNLLTIRSINAILNVDVTLMADDVKWSNHQIELSNSDVSLNGHNEQAVVFDIEKLIQVRNVFSSITVRVECNRSIQENIVQSDELLQKIICAFCGDFLTSDYYQCYGKHMHCATCHTLGNSFIIGHRYGTRVELCSNCKESMLSDKHFLTVIDSLQTFKYPCENQSLGCKEYIPRFTSKHELLCPFKIFNCAFDNCEFTGNNSEFISHLQENHTDDIVNKNVCDITSKSDTRFYMFAFGSVFLCTASYCECSIEWISTSILKHNFVFEVTFTYGFGKRVTLRTHTNPRGITVEEKQKLKSVYNIIKKTANFYLYGDLLRDKIPDTQTIKVVKTST